MSLKTLWDGNEIDVVDCLVSASGTTMTSYVEWCSEFRCEVHNLIAQGYNVFSSMLKNYVSDIRDCGSYDAKDNLEIFFICLNKDILNENTTGFIHHFETDFDDDVYTLKIPTYYWMTKAAAKHVANCLHWLDYNHIYMLPMNVDEIRLAKLLKPENPDDTKKVEKARLEHESRMKVFDIVFWWEQYFDWKDEYDEEYPKLEERIEKYKKENKDIIECCFRVHDKIMFRRKIVDDFPEECKTYHKMKEDRDEWWNESFFFRHIIDDIRRNRTPEERSVAHDAMKSYITNKYAA